MTIYSSPLMLVSIVYCEFILFVEYQFPWLSFV